MRKALVLFVLLLLFAGCIKEKTVSFPEYEKIYSVNVFDGDGDGVADVRFYKFSPFTMEDSGLEVTFDRLVVVYPSEIDVSVLSVREITPEDVEKLESLLVDFEGSRKKEEEKCLTALGIRSCSGIDGCANSCNSNACLRFKDFASEPLGFVIYSFMKNREEMDKTVAELEAMLPLLPSASSQDKAKVLEKLNYLLLLTMKINANPLMDKNVFGICSPLSYKVDNIREMMGIIGNSSYSVLSYNYVVVIDISSKSTSAYGEVLLKDRPPLSLVTTMVSHQVFQKGKIYGSPLTIIWPSIKTSTYPRYILLYSITSTLPPKESIFEKWNTPEATVRIVSLSMIPFLAELLNFSKSLFSSLVVYLGYYPSLGVVFGMWIIIILFLVQILRSFFAVILAFIDRKPIFKSFVRSLGEANPYWLRYLTSGLILLLFSWAIQHYLAKGIGEGELVFSNALTYLGEDFYGFLSFLLSFVGVVLIYLVVEDKGKGLVGGKEYYKNILELSPEANRKRLEELKKKMEQLQHIILEYGKKNIDTTKEYELLTSVPLERLEKLIEEGEQRAARDILNAYLNKVEDAISALREKEKIAIESWPKWEAYIYSLLEESDVVSLDSLISIPQPWRVWAASRFVEEHPEEGVVLEGDVLKKVARTPEEIAASLVSALARKGMIVGGVFFKGNTFVGGHFERGKDVVLKVVAIKMFNEASSLAKELLSGELEGFACEGRKIKIFSAKNNDVFALLIGEKEKEKFVTEFIEKKLGRM